MPVFSGAVDIQVTYTPVVCVSCGKTHPGGHRVVVNDKHERFCNMRCEETWRHRFDPKCIPWDNWGVIDKPIYH